MKVVLLCIGGLRSEYLSVGIADYLRRLQHYTPTELLEVQEKKSWRKLPPNERLREEGKAILSRLEPRDHLVLFDERGAAISSRKFAERLEKYSLAGHKRLVLAIGGAFGFSDEVYAAAGDRLSLSSLTFNHEMVRLIALEQLYRAYSILRGEPYHND